MEEWVSMTEAAKTLGISYDKLSRLVRKRAINTKSDIVDERVKYVEIGEIKKVLRIKN
jgi:predicted HTH domain antitoxin